MQFINIFRIDSIVNPVDNQQLVIEDENEMENYKQVFTFFKCIIILTTKVKAFLLSIYKLNF